MGNEAGFWDGCGKNIMLAVVGVFALGAALYRVVT